MLTYKGGLYGGRVPFIRAILINSYSFSLFGSLGYGGFSGPPPEDGS